MTSVVIKKSLVLEVIDTPAGGTPQLVQVQLSRLGAQQLADALKAYAMGGGTKSASEYVTARSVRSSVVRL